MAKVTTWLWELPFSCFHGSKRFIQRGLRGWADRDVWDLGNYLEGILAGALGRLAETANGHPCITGLELSDEEAQKLRCRGGQGPPCHCSHLWFVELYRNAELFNRLHRDEFWKLEEEIEVREEALTWLKKRWGRLWI